VVPRKNTSVRRFFFSATTTVNGGGMIRFVPLLYAFTIFIGVQLLVMHVLALQFYLYWLVWWFDLLVHFVGGIWLVFAGASLYRIQTGHKDSSVKLSVVLLCALGIFVLWEGFGIFVSGGLKEGWVADTLTDTLCGILGVLVGYFVSLRIKILES